MAAKEEMGAPDVVPASAPATTQSTFGNIIEAISQIQQYAVIERSGQDVPDDFLTIKGKLSFFNIGFGSGFVEGIAFALLAALILPIMADQGLLHAVARYFPLVEYRWFLMVFNCLPIILSASICCYLSRYRIGIITKKSVDNLLVGRVFSLMIKGAILFMTLIFLSNWITAKSAWNVATFFSLKKMEIANTIYRIIWNMKPLLLTTAYEVLFVFLIAAIVPFFTIWMVSIYRQIAARRIDTFWDGDRDISARYFSDFLDRKSESLSQTHTALGHGVKLADEKPQIEPILLKDSDRKGHTFIFGSTRIGKTKLAENMICQDIRKGRSVAFFDPKGDIELFSKIVQEAKEANRLDEVFLVTPIYPNCSALIDPLSFWYMPEELVSHVTSGIKAKEEFFLNVAYDTTLAIVQSILFLQKHDLTNWVHLNFEAIKIRCSFNGLTELRNQIGQFENEEAREILGHLDQLLSSPQDFFAKISSSLRTVLTSLSTGSVGQIIGKAQTNKFMQRLEEGKRVILVVQTGSLLTRRTAHTVARVLISMLQAFVGRRFASGKTIDPPLCMYMDEFSNLAYLDIADLFNKAGGAGIWLHAFTQSVADLAAEIGKDHARKILDNCNTKIFMRVNDPETADYIATYSGKIKKFQPILQLGGGIMIREVDESAILIEDAMKLKVRDFYMFTYEGAYRGRAAMVPPGYVKVVFPEVQLVEQTKKANKENLDNNEPTQDDRSLEKEEAA